MNMVSAGDRYLPAPCIKPIKKSNVLLLTSMKEIHDELLKQREAGVYRLDTISRAINALDNASQRIPFVEYEG